MTKFKRNQDYSLIDATCIKNRDEENILDPKLFASSYRSRKNQEDYSVVERGVEDKDSKIYIKKGKKNYLNAKKNNKN